MQHTDKYKLNIIETSDPFSPDALNANARTLETQLARVEAELAALDAAKADQTALDALDAGRLVWTTGTYTGDGEYGKAHPNRIEFDFKPLAVIVTGSSQYGNIPWLYGQSSGLTGASLSVSLTWGDRDVSWYSGTSASYQLNTTGTHRYFALGLRD